MPAIRDYTWSTTTVATGTTLILPVPTSATNDLLLAVFMGDTTGGTWTSPGWTHAPGSPFVNTTQMIVMWRIAVASEAASYTFTGTLAESYNGSIISIRDVNTLNPFGAVAVTSFVAQAAAAKFNMQTITTNVASSLLIYAFANSSVGVPSFLEGPVNGIVGADGVAESLGIGWGFQSATGVTSALVGVSNIVSGIGVNTVLQIAPPLTGATVIPTYCSQDLSLYIDPINGVSPYNGNTAIGITADTGFSTTLGGRTAADAAVAAVADVGINSFHSVARVTSISASINLSGVELVLATANKPSVAGKNIMVHLGPSTEGQLQRFSSISSGRGIWFGMRSGAAVDYKIWQVYGAELGSLRHQPVIINSNALNVKATNGTLNAASIAAFGFWVSGIGVGTTVWDFAVLWVLDTITICGGILAEPIDIAGIVNASSIGKERKSVLRQGSNQALSYQPIQFGNGGVSSTYLLLDSTAIEFPSQYNAATKQVSYNSTDNVVGITYNAGASDTIKHVNSVISSPSDYHWRIHASSSASAVYDFSGLALIGAGDVVLRNVTTFSGMSLVNCTLVTQNSAPITSSVIRNTKILSNGLTPISKCAFTSGGAGTGHAIELNTAGTYTFSGNTFSGYDANDSTDAAIYNNSGGAVTINITNSGTTPTIRNGTAATTTVSSAISLTLTGLKTGSDIVILTAGTSVVLLQVDSHNGDSFVYNFTAGGNVDIGVIKEGYVVFYIRGYMLPLANTSIPINQTIDRNFS